MATYLPFARSSEFAFVSSSPLALSHWLIIGRIVGWRPPLFTALGFVAILTLIGQSAPIKSPNTDASIHTSRTLRGRVIDTDGKPIPYAWIIQRFTDVSFPDDQIEFQTDDQGRFDFRIPEMFEVDNSLPVSADQIGFFVFAPGYIVRALYGNFVLDREIEVVLTTQETKEVELVDVDGHPIADALVSPWNGSVGLGLSMQSRLSSKTDSNGRATLANYDENLSSIHVTLVDGEQYLFALPDLTSTQQQTLRCVVKRFQSTIRVTVLDFEGKPLGKTAGRDVLVFAATSEEEINPLTLKAPTVRTQAFGKLKNDSVFSFPATSPEKVSLSIRIPGVNEIVREVKPIRDQVVQVVIRAPQRFPTAICVMKSGSGEPVVGARVAFTRGRTYWNMSVTDEDGFAQCDLEAGEWECTIDEQLPEGLAFSGKSSKYNVTQSRAMQSDIQIFPPLIIEPAKKLTGHIRDIDFKQQLVNWCGVSHTNVLGNSQFFSGTVNNDGDFEILIPSSLDITSLKDFQINYNDRGVILNVISNAPLILKRPPTQPQ